MTTREYTKWQFEQRDCECVIHRYHIGHLCLCGEVISHSQAAFDYHKFHGGMLDFDTFWYKHGDTLADIFDRYVGYGFNSWWIENNRKVYNEIADKFN